MLVNLIIIPEDSRNGKDKPITKVRVFSGLGNRAGDRVASSNPSDIPTHRLDKTKQD